MLLSLTDPERLAEGEVELLHGVLMQYADQLAVPANHAGIPAISFPGGLDADGLPIGVQLLGPDFTEGVLLQLTHAYEQATPDAEWRKVHPAVLREA